MIPNDTELVPHIEDLKRALGENISTEKIIEELKKYFEYGIEVGEAKKAVVKKLGGDLNLLFTGIERKLSEVQPTDRNINLKAKILSVNEKNVTVQGNEKLIYYGLLADSTMVRPFTAWDDFNLQKNDVVQINSAYAKDWRGEPQINLGNSTSVLPLEDPNLATLNSTNLPSALPSIEYKINTLRNGMSNITVLGRILSVEPRTVTVLDEAKEIYTGKLADETGKIAFTAWNDFDLKPNEIIKVMGAYVRSWRGVPKLNFDERMELEHLADDSLPPIDELGPEKINKIINILELGGGIDILIEGTILEIKEGSGLIYRCPECKRVLRANECMIHGSQQGVADLRVKAIIDDGTGAIIMVLNANLTSKLLGKNIEECESEITEKGPDYANQIIDELNEILIMQPMRVKGTITIDDYGAMMICSEIDQMVLSEEVLTKVNEILKELNLDGSIPEVP